VAVLWIVRTGAPWRDQPEAFGSWNSVFRRFRHWAQVRIFGRLFEFLSVDPDFEYALIDGTIIRFHQHGTGAKGDLSSGRRTLARRPDHPDRGSSGCARQPADFLLLLAQRHDSVGAEPLLEGLEMGALIADKGFDNDALRQELDARGAIVVSPSKANRARPMACNFAMYRWRDLVENFLCP
jgi:transposase